MKESEFDIQVRNLLLNAEEPVSPAVWDAVAAGLAPKKRVVPAWLWWSSAVAVAAAAAVVVGVFLFRPAGLEAVPSAGLLAQVTGAPASLVLPEVSASPAVRPAWRPTAPQREVSAIEAIETPVLAPQTVLLKDAGGLALPPQESRRAQVQDHALLNQLAYSRKEEESGRSFSLLAMGNIQGNSRGNVTEQPGRRTFGAPSNQTGERVYNEGPDNFRLPFSVGIGAKYNFTPRWAVGLGVRYTNLSRSFLANYDSGDGWGVKNTETDNSQHWIGIPLNVYYDMVNRGRWRVHTFVGGSVEYLLDNSYVIHNSPKDIFYHEPGTHFQWSAGIGLGVEFRITPHFGVFLDPSFRYYFDHMNQPRSLRTIQPLRFDMEAGLRFSFGKF